MTDKDLEKSHQHDREHEKPKESHDSEIEKADKSHQIGEQRNYSERLPTSPSYTPKDDVTSPPPDEE